MLPCVKWHGWQFWIQESKVKFIKNYFNTTFPWLVCQSSRPFDSCSAPLARLGSRISRGGVPQHSTDTRFYGLQNGIGAPLQDFWILPESINPILCSLIKGMFHIPSFREAMFGDPYLSPCPWDHFAASCRISLKTRTPGYTQNLFFFGTSEFLLATGRMLPGARLVIWSST